MRILIKQGEIINPSPAFPFQSSILIEDGIIKKISPQIEGKFDKVIEAKGKYVIPALWDVHAHLREPGREDEETIVTGGRAAVKGGYAGVCCMPNTQPPIDEPSVVEYIKERAKYSPSLIFPIGCISKRREGKELCEMGLLKEAGVVGFSDDGDPVTDSQLLRRAMEYSLSLNLPLILHCEDKALSGNGVMHEGLLSTILGLPGIPREAEELMVKRDLELARLTSARIHIAHLSSKGSVEYIKEAKNKGINVTCEVTPHHLLLTVEAVKEFNTNTKVNPPLREEEDRQALLEGLKNGIIDVISTDHAPHLSTEKEEDYLKAPFGMIGLEISFSLLYTELVLRGIFTLAELVKFMSFNPSKIFGLPGGEIKEGCPAFISIFDPEKEWVISKKEFASLSSNTPFLGKKVKGKFEWVIVEHKIPLENFELRG